MDIDEIERFLAEQFPQVSAFGATIESVGHRVATLHLDVAQQHLRPGGAVSGPTLMTLVDMAVYVAVLGELGAVGAVTTHLGIHFLHRASTGRLVAEAALLKVGRRSVVGDVRVTSANAEGPVAKATVSYALPSS